MPACSRCAPGLITTLSITTEITSEVAKHFTAGILISHAGFYPSLSLVAIFLNLEDLSLKVILIRMTLYVYSYRG